MQADPDSGARGIPFSFEVDRYSGQPANNGLTFIYALLPEREPPLIVGLETAVEMNLVQIGTNEFSPNLFVSLQMKGTYSPARTATRNWGDAIKVQRLLNSSCPSRGDPLPPVLVMETAENCASHDLAVLREGMSVVTLQR